MTIPLYTQGYPPDGSSLGETKPVIRDNLDGTFLTLGVDHINNNGQPGSNPAGYHNIIHQVTKFNVSTTPGVNLVFAGIPGSLRVNGILTPAIPNNGDTQLYALTGAAIGLSGLSQLTGNSALANGYQWIGGMLVQWGTKNGTRGSDNHFNGGDPITVSFNDPPTNFTFPNACFGVWTQPCALSTNQPASTSTANVSINSDQVLTTGFTGKWISSGSSYTSFFWIAIGY